jgi:hypothetical protein
MILDSEFANRTNDSCCLIHPVDINVEFPGVGPDAHGTDRLAEARRGETRRSRSGWKRSVALRSLPGTWNVLVEDQRARGQFSFCLGA